MKKLLCLALALLLTLSLATACAEPRTVTFWHCFGGTIGEAIQEIVDAFNASQVEIVVVAQYQGAYDDTLTKTVAEPIDAYQHASATVGSYALFGGGAGSPAAMGGAAVITASVSAFRVT